MNNLNPSALEIVPTQDPEQLSNDLTQLLKKLITAKLRPELNDESKE